jgi:hypothetical protein
MQRENHESIISKNPRAVITRQPQLWSMIGLITLYIAIFLFYSKALIPKRPTVCQSLFYSPTKRRTIPVNQFILIL